MSERDRTEKGGDSKRVRDHVRKVLSKLAALQQEKRKSAKLKKD